MGTTNLDASWERSASERAECCDVWQEAHHAGAWEDVPAQADSITVLDLTPLLLEGVVIHRVGCRRRGLAREVVSRIGVANESDSFAAVGGERRRCCCYICASCHQHRAVVERESGGARRTFAKAGGSGSVARRLLCAGNSGIGDGIEGAAAASSSGPVCEAQMATSMAAGGGVGGMVRRSRRVNQARRPGGQIGLLSPHRKGQQFQVGPSPGRCARASVAWGCGCCGRTLAATEGSTKQRQPADPQQPPLPSDSFPCHGVSRVNTQHHNQGHRRRARY